MTTAVIRKYARLWFILTIHSFLHVLSSRFGAILFFFGKALRFIFFIVFLLTIFTQTKVLASYTSTQMLLFYLTYSLIDTVTQLLFREVYRFRTLVVSGDFDLVLVAPMNPLFRSLMGGADPLDLLMLIPYTGSLLYVGSQLSFTYVNLLAYMLLVFNAIIIAAGFHILVLALAILTTEIDHTIMIYRDITSMGRIPVDIYREPIRSIITFIFPVGVMMTFPAKAMLGLLTPVFILASCLLGILIVLVSLNLWRYALSRYASASS